jgi:hypothetical protein
LRRKRQPRSGKAALPAIVVAGSGLAAGSAAALELGELQVQSTLGQPLRASIAYALGADELIQERCVSIRSGGRDLPGLHNASVNVSKGVISVAGSSPVTEPILSATVVVDCPYSAHVSRNYLMFIDPQRNAGGVARPATATATAPAPRSTAGAERAARVPTAVSPGSRYQVQRGDSLSGIVQRLEDRSISIAGTMAAILDANPQAFINRDPDRLKAGSRLDIPSFAGTSVAAKPLDAPQIPDSPAEPRGGESVASRAPADASAYRGAETLEPDAGTQLPSTEFMPEVVEPEVAGTVEAVAEAVADDTATEGDYSAAYADVLPRTVVDVPGASESVAPETAAATAGVAAGTRIVGLPRPAGSAWNWLIWAAVALISAFGSYLVFWPKLRARFGSQPVDPEERVQGPSGHSMTQIAPISVPESEMTVQEIRPTYDNVDFDLSEESPTEENLTIDADLIDGTGFDDSADADVNRDFGFAATMDLDMELPEHAATEDLAPETDIIPPPERPAEDLVVSSEVLPEQDEDEYDISILLDATKMPDPAAVTERDLRAFPIEDTDQVPINDDYTIVDEIGQDILRQDYEEELTATQLLNPEIDAAVADLADAIGKSDVPAGGATPDERDDGGRLVGYDDDTSIEMQLTNLSDLDLTATLEAQNDDMDDTPGMAASVETEDKTVEMARDTDGARAR